MRDAKRRIPQVGRENLRENLRFAGCHPDCPVTVSSPNPRFIYALFEGNGRQLLIMLNDTDSEVSETVSAKGLSSVGKDIFSGAAYDFSSGSCRVVLPPRESAFVLFAK